MLEKVAHVSGKRSQFVLTAVVVSVSVMPFLLTPWKAQALGPAGRGEISFFQSGLAILLTIGALGARHAYYEIRSLHNARVPVRSGRSMTVAAVATAVALGIILAIGHSRMSGIVTISLVVGGAISVFQPFVQRELAEAQSSYRRTSVAFISTTPAAVETATTIGLLLVRQMSVVWSALASLLAEIARIVVAFISWLRTGRRVSAASPSTAVDLSRQTIRLGIVTILPILVTNVDTVAFAAFVPTETLGSFAVTKVVVTLMILVASTLEGTVVRAAPRTVWRYFLLYAALGVAAGAAGYAFAPLLFGQAFEPSRFAFVSSAAASIFAATYSTLATRAVWRGNSALAIRASLVAFLTVTIAAIAIGYLVVRPSAWMLALPALLSYISAIAIILIWSRKEKGQE